MDRDFAATFEGDHVRIISRGQHSLDYGRAIWTEIASVCEAHQCYVVLGLSQTPQPLPVVDGYGHAELFRELGIDSRYRIAWVEETAEARQALRFVEDVLVNRGLPGRLFESEEDARQWLFADS
jgi:hypothetical protein